MVSGKHWAWGEAFRRAWYVGSIASVASSWVIARRSRIDSLSASSGTNATSHWLWGDIAKHQYDLSARYTGVGYVIHHASAFFWAFIYERLFPAPRLVKMPETVASAAVVSALAAGTDYLLTPQRLRPGYEQHLSIHSMIMVYAGFAAGLAAGRYLYAHK